MNPEPIDSGKHPALLAASALSNALTRAARGQYLIEGERLVRQALALDRPDTPSEVFVVDEPGETRDALLEALAPSPATVRLLPPGLVPKLLGTKYATSPGTVAVVPRSPLPAMPEQGLLLLGETVQDPRNVGVLLRTAEAAGVAAVAFTDDSADPYSRPAVRSTTGSILRQPLHLTADLPGLCRQLRDRGVRVLGTSAKAATAVWDADLTGDVAVVLGNESVGLSDAAREAVDDVVSLPVCGGASSLNITVAAGVLLYEAVRIRG